jgi:hypothetical protein
MGNEADTLLNMAEDTEDTEDTGVYLMVDGSKITDIKEIVDYVKQELEPTLEEEESTEEEMIGPKELPRQNLEGTYEDPMLDLRLGAK